MKKIVSVMGVMVALVLSLTGCMKMDVDLAVLSPEKASMTMVMAVDTKVVGEASVPELLGKMGTSEEELFKKFPEKAQKRPYEQDGFKGYTFTTEEISLLDMGDLSGELGPKVDIEYRDGQYHFSAAGLGGANASSMSESTMTVTFPGKVVSASEGAHIQGNTVSFDMLTANGTMSAVANPKDNTPMYLSLGFAGLALVGAVLAVALMRRSDASTEAHA